MSVAKGIGDSIRDLLDELVDHLRERRDEAKVAAAIRSNTAALSGLSSYPPSKEPPVTTEPGKSVEAALAEQTDAIASLSQELADEHQEWLDAVEAGDSDQAQQIVNKVQENTDKLNSLAQDLASSHPGSQPEGPTGPDEGAPYPDQTLPGDLEDQS